MVKSCLGQKHPNFCLILTVKSIYENKPYGTSFENLLNG